MQKRKALISVKKVTGVAVGDQTFSSDLNCCKTQRRKLRNYSSKSLQIAFLKVGLRICCTVVGTKVCSCNFKNRINCNFQNYLHFKNVSNIFKNLVQNLLFKLIFEYILRN